MKIFSGFSLSDNITFMYKDYNCINIYYIYNIYKNNNYLEYFNILNKNIELNNIIKLYIFNPAYDILFEHIKDIEYINIDFNIILHIYIYIFMSFNKIGKIIKEPIKLIQHIPNYLRINNKLIVRPGIVELKACSINNYNLIVNSINKISQKINNKEDIINIKKKLSYNWLTITHDSNDYENIIVSLMTNAGFYINDDNSDALNNFFFFKDGYINAIKNADYLMNWPFVNCYALNILNEKKQIKDCKYIDVTLDTNLVLLFDNKKILFVTCFKKLIDMQYLSGNIYKLRDNNNLTNIKLDTIESFLTTYPNRKHNNFIETYNYYTLEIDKMFSNNNYDIFTCSCGCYGLLLCNYVYTKYNITSIYIGNCINHFFGICHNNNYNSYYLKSDLNERYENINDIDNNSYGYNAN